MLTLEIGKRHLARLKRELRHAGDREIGGVLAGEDLGGGRFSIADLSVQRFGGTIASFVRDPQHRSVFLRSFFAKTGSDFQRFNYLGEWHSHPLYSVCPSGVDRVQMQALVQAPDEAAHFIILMVVRLNGWGEIQASAHAFQRGHPPIEIQIVPSGVDPSLTWIRCLRGVLRRWRRA